MDFGSSGSGKVLQDVRRNLSSDKEIALSLAYTNIAHGFSCNPFTHECTQKITVRGGVAVKEGCPQTNQRSIFFV